MRRRLEYWTIKPYKSNYNSTTPKYTNILEVLAEVEKLILPNFSHYLRSPLGIGS